MRKTIASWEELVDYIKHYKKDDKRLILMPVKWYGEKAKDRKTKEDKDEVGNVLSITFDVAEVPKETQKLGLRYYLSRL